MATLYTHKDSNIRKTFLLFTIFLVVVIGVGWVFSRAFGDPSILYIAVLFSVLMNVVAYWYSDKLVLSMTHAKAVTRESHRELYTIVENLCITAGLPMPKIYTVPERQPNAFATGRNPKHAALAVTEGLLEILDRSELEGVLSHELSHIVIGICLFPPRRWFLSDLLPSSRIFLCGLCGFGAGAMTAGARGQSCCLSP